MQLQPLPQDLLKTALLGTERQTQAPHGNSALQPYLAQLYPQGQVPAGSNRESAFLGAVALALHYRAAGAVPTPFTGTLPPPDQGADLPLIPPAAELHLRRMLVDNSLRPLLDGWLETVATRRLRVPAGFIPTLLELAQQSRRIRPALSVVIGQRGHWLAKQRQEWQRLLVLAPEPEQGADSAIPHPAIWDEGNTDQRSEYLRQVRAQDPVAARGLLQAVWKQESAAVRQDLLATLTVGLSLADEAWLESCLDDRSKGVRQLAASLLGGLTGSAFSQRAQARLLGWLAVQGSGGLLGKLTGKKTLQVNLPEAWDKAWLRDGIEEKPPQGTGAKAWWLEQALSYVPPAVWTQHWQVEPAEMLAYATKSDWKAPLLSGWQAALGRYPDSRWAQVWLLQTDARASSLWQVLSVAEAEQSACELLGRAKKLEHCEFLTQLGHEWSQPFSMQVLLAVASHIDRKQTYVYSIYSLFRHLAVHLDASCVDALADSWQQPLQAEDHPFHSLLTETLFTVRFRADMLAALHV